MKPIEITRKVETLLAQAKITKPPVQPLDIARLMGITVKRGPLPDDLSGFLVHENNAACIGVNSLHPKPRQAFTIAHELGHFVLHPSANFVDRKLIYFRDIRATAAIDIREIQANQFAADLLMPSRFLQEALKGTTVDLEDEETVGRLTKRFGVSAQALMFRLMNLNLAHHK